MLQTMFVALMFAAWSTQADANAQLTTSDVAVEVGLNVYRPDGTVSHSVITYRPGGSVSGSALGIRGNQISTAFYMGKPCMYGAGTRGPSEGRRALIEATEGPVEITHRWSMLGRLLHATGKEAVVRFEWRRDLSEGVVSSRPPETVELTLHPGDRVPLDVITTGQANCPRIGLEIRFVVRGGAVSASFSAGSGGGMVSGARRGGAAGRGTGVVGAGPAQDDVASAANGLVDFDLWLVRKRPGGREEAQHQRLGTLPRGRVFSFRPVEVQTSAGQATVEVSGSLAVRILESGERQLLFAVGRNVTLASPRRADAPDIRGSTAFVGTLPNSYEVLSFEMPPVEVGGGTAADQFSVRVQVTPVERR